MGFALFWFGWACLWSLNMLMTDRVELSLITLFAIVVFVMVFNAEQPTDAIKIGLNIAMLGTFWVASRIVEFKAVNDA